MFSPTAQQVCEVAEKYNHPKSKVKDAMVKLGHADGEMVDRYIQERGWAVIRYVRDKDGNKRRMTDDDIAARYSKK